MSVLDGVSAFARVLLPHPFVLWLRGDFKSVRGRFITDKKDRLKLLFYRLRGGDYLSWYARRMDGFAPHRIEGHGRAHVNDYHESGIQDLETMKQLGLKPQHTLHEFGCGFLRSARYFADYLENGNFSANDASGGRIDAGLNYLKDEGFDFDDHGSKITVNTDNSLEWVGRKVDYVWCHAVFTHMPEKDIEDVVKNLPKIMHDATQFIFTYSEKSQAQEESKQMGVKDWWHKHAFFDDLAKRHGLAIEDLSPLLESRGVYNPKNRMAKLTLAS